MKPADHTSHGAVDVDREQGSITIVLVGVVATALLLTAAIALAGRVFLAAERARAAADESALAAATVLLRAAAATTPCEAAARAAQANEAHLERCQVWQDSVQVEVSVPGIERWNPTSVARAGEPELVRSAEGGA